jgi:hypothetical protein
MAGMHKVEQQLWRIPDLIRTTGRMPLLAKVLMINYSVISKISMIKKLLTQTLAEANPPTTAQLRSRH